MSLSDIATKDHEDNVPRDKYEDDIVEEMDENFHENHHVLDVRWMEWIDRLDKFQLLHHLGGGNFIDTSVEHFQGVHVDDYFGLN